MFYAVEISMFKIFKILKLPKFCFVDRASLYNLVNKANLVHNFS